jgi:hypothetical protein
MATFKKLNIPAAGWKWTLLADAAQQHGLHDRHNNLALANYRCNSSTGAVVSPTNG